MKGDKEQFISDLKIIKDNVTELFQGVAHILMDIDYLSNEVKESLEDDKKKK